MHTQVDHHLYLRMVSKYDHFYVFKKRCTFLYIVLSKKKNHITYQFQNFAV